MVLCGPIDQGSHMSWFGKEKSPDGTNIIRHNAVERKFGFTEKSTAGFAQKREAAYEKLFGKALRVSHEVLPQVPHIDVYIFQRSRGDQIEYSLVTGGMSDLKMTLPRRAKDVPRRVELIFYCAEPRDEYISTLRWIAHFPHDSKSWLGYGHTMPNGAPPSPFLGKHRTRYASVYAADRDGGPEFAGPTAIGCR